MLTKRVVVVTGLVGRYDLDADPDLGELCRGRANPVVVKASKSLSKSLVNHLCQAIRGHVAQLHYLITSLLFFKMAPSIVV